jgi:hypothetical protein
LIKEIIIHVPFHNCFNLSSSYILNAWVADCQRLWSLTYGRATDANIQQLDGAVLFIAGLHEYS